MQRHLRIANLPAHWLFLPPLAFAALNNIALKSESASGPFLKLATEEVSSVAVIFALVPLLIGVARRWPPALGVAALARHLGGSMVFSALHVLGMLAIRYVVFAAAGIDHRPAPLPDMLLCEYGKDLAAYALIVTTIDWFDRRFPLHSNQHWKPSLPHRGGEGLGEVGRAASPREPQARDAVALVRNFHPHPPHLTQPSPPSSRAERASVSFEVNTRRGTVIVTAGEILRVEAAGNYATLVTAQGAFLHRATMREIEAALPPELFARAHRSHIVRLDAIAAIRGAEGEREIRLCNGDAVPLSRRHAQARDWHVSLHLGSAKASR
ncbi:LytR/AlgR family response regulator transcription factor [Desertibaculum subflavum]|uniref:LytR/AlgR family response regulator transcription factor n=1 Tax=Desertibaculum subflavum TaxID=2268458 RepID=UPI000E6643E8